MYDKTIIKRTTNKDLNISDETVLNDLLISLVSDISLLTLSSDFELN